MGDRFSQKLKMILQFIAKLRKFLQKNVAKRGTVLSSINLNNAGFGLTYFVFQLLHKTKF